MYSDYLLFIFYLYLQYQLFTIVVFIKLFIIGLFILYLSHAVSYSYIYHTRWK